MVLAFSLKLIWPSFSLFWLRWRILYSAYTTTLLGSSKWKSRYLLKWSARTVPKKKSCADRRYHASLALREWRHWFQRRNRKNRCRKIGCLAYWFTGGKAVQCFLREKQAQLTHGTRGKELSNQIDPRHGPRRERPSERHSRSNRLLPPLLPKSSFSPQVNQEAKLQDLRNQRRKKHQ